MFFSSAHFLFLFLPLLLGLYFLCPRSGRNLLLLGVSLLFYTWSEGRYLLVLLGSISWNYAMGLWLGRLHSSRSRSLALFTAVAGNLSLLLTYKYANFLVDNVNVLLTAAGVAPRKLAPVHLPVGISFFTFHALSYVIDVYRREAAALRNPIDFALYISFFPQAIAGPIVRYTEVARQLTQRQVTRAGFALGIKRFTVGLAKKMLIANTLAVPADAIFGLPDASLNASLAWLGSICYTLQIYFDFSGYSDMALGLARMFGFRFPENFAYPYVSTSITEFWRRWHISLSSWYRDYLYIPLGGNRGGRWRTCRNLLIVFALCGLWHGASWSFLVWGLFHGSFLMIERLGLGRLLQYVWPPLRHGYLLLVVLIGWVFFQAKTLTQAMAFLSAMLGGGQGDGRDFNAAMYMHPELVLVLMVGVVGCTPCLPLLRRLRVALALAVTRRLRPALQAMFAGAEVTTVALLLLASMMLLAGGTYNPFIYFRF